MPTMDDPGGDVPTDTSRSASRTRRMGNGHDASDGYHSPAPSDGPYRRYSINRSSSSIFEDVEMAQDEVSRERILHRFLEPDLLTNTLAAQSSSPGQSQSLYPPVYPPSIAAAAVPTPPRASPSTQTPPKISTARHCSPRKGSSLLKI